MQNKLLYRLLIAGLIMLGTAAVQAQETDDSLFLDDGTTVTSDGVKESV